MPNSEIKQIRCSFCGKKEGQVKRLIAGPGVFICDECIDLCCEILHDDYMENEFDEEFPYDEKLSNPTGKNNLFMLSIIKFKSIPIKNKFLISSKIIFEVFPAIFPLQTADEVLPAILCGLPGQAQSRAADGPVHLS